MKGGKIRFFTEIPAFRLKNKKVVSKWLLTVGAKFQKNIGAVNYIFCNDAYMLPLNQEFLHHNTYTDIITFDHSTQPNIIEADIYISIERVTENAEKLNVNATDELHRVMVHGLLHLCGLKDKTKAQSAEMRAAENEALGVYGQMLLIHMSLK